MTQQSTHEKSIYENNPLHGLTLDALLEELVSHYGWEILAEYTLINCFKNNPSMESSMKFFKKTAWAREKIERFYLYDFKNLPKASSDQFDISPRDRIIPAHHKPSTPKVLIEGQAPIPVEKNKYNKPQKEARNNANKSSNKGDSSNKDPWAHSPK